MGLELVDQRHQLTLDRGAADAFGAVFRSPFQRERRGQHVGIARHHGDEIRRLSIGGHARVEDVDRPHLQAGLPRRSDIVGKGAILGAGALARFEIDEIRAQPPQRGERNRPIPRADQGALIGPFRLVRAPAARFPPAPCCGNQSQQHENRESLCEAARTALSAGTRALGPGPPRSSARCARHPLSP